MADKEHPTTPKKTGGRDVAAGRTGDPRTLRNLIEAAKRVFSEKIYLDATVDDVVRLAGCARGTFYLYFKDKEDIFERVVDEVVREIYEDGAELTGVSTIERMKARNSRYLEAVQKHAGLMRNVHLVSAFNPRVASLEQRNFEQFVARMRKHMERHVRNADCDDLDLNLASWALLLMIGRFGYFWLSLKQLPGGETLEMDKVVATLSSLLYRVIYLQPASSTVDC